MDFLAAALSGKPTSEGTFGKASNRMDEMVDLLEGEQLGDDREKAYYAKQFDQADDRGKALERKVSDDDSTISTAEEGIATLIDEMQAL